MASKKRKRKKKQIRKSGSFDYTMLFITAVLIGIGLIMIYSTSGYASEMKGGDSMAYFKKQASWVAVGFGLMIAAYNLPYHFWENRLVTVGIFGISLALILSLPVIGTTVKGATRWIRIGGFSFQPAELVKIGVILVTAWIVVKAQQGEIKKFTHWLLIIALTAGLPFFLVYTVSDNLSSAIIVAMIPLVMMFVAYRGKRLYLALSGVLVAAVAIIVKIASNAQATGGSFRTQRIVVWLNPEAYATGKGFQTIQSLYAIGSGGFFGKGLGKSLQKLGYIPESQNDMIFSVICEELGFFGASLIIILFGFLLWRIMVTSQEAPDVYGMYLAIGIFAQIATQVVLNIAVVTNLIPNTGISLPFISYGGTSVALLMAEMGVVLNISACADPGRQAMSRGR